MATTDFTLAELLICACAEVWRDDGEVLATGIGIIPRLAQGLAKLTHSPELMITDGEAYLTEEPVVLGAKNHDGRRYGGWMPYARVFDNVWGGRTCSKLMPGCRLITRIACPPSSLRPPKSITHRSVTMRWMRM